MTPFLDDVLGFFRKKDGGSPPPAPSPALPADETRGSVRRWLVERGLSDERARQLVALALPGIRMRVDATAVDDWPAIGLSKLGGLPDVPADWTWPEFKGVPLMFIGQVNLGELARMPAASALPSEGTLAFFYHMGPDGAWGSDPEDLGSARVFWFRDVKALRRAGRPARMPADGVFPAGRLAMREALTLPDTSHLDVEPMGLTEEEDEAYRESLHELHLRDGETTQHLLLGHAAPIQDEMTEECEEVTSGIDDGGPARSRDPRRLRLEGGARRWRLLAQVDSDDAVDMMWGDAGMLYFWIREEDLAARRFDRAWMVLQCS